MSKRIAGFKKNNNRMNRQSNNIFIDTLNLLCSMLIGYGAAMVTIAALLACNIFDSNGEPMRFLLFSHAIITIDIFIVGPLAYWHFVKKKVIYDFFYGEQRYLQFGLLTAALIVVTMLVNTYFVYWNLQLKLPACLSEIELWIKAKEAGLKHLTNLLTTFSSWQDLGMGIIVLCLIPAIGEEVVFRGLLQSMFNQRFYSHFSILVTAFIFSVIHLQFYGFIPRFLLGALFGYIYNWTQNLFYPILAHFLNNSLTLILSFIQQHSSHKFDAEHQLLPLPIFISCLLISFRIGSYIYQKTQYLRHL